jgi:sec-independent protein translocase protein TatA
MPNIGPMELLIVAVIALIVLGPKRLPDAGKSLGKGLREFKGAISGRDEDDDREASELAAIQPVEPPRAERREAEPVA